MAEAKNIVKTGVSNYGETPSCYPSGKVVTDGKMSTIPGLPERSMGKDSVPEVTLDENGGLPTRTGKK